MYEFYLFFAYLWKIIFERMKKNHFYESKRGLLES